MAEPWCDPNTFGSVFGAVGGGLGGLFGAAVGTLSSWLTPRGRGKRLIIGLMWAAVVIGLGSLLFGLAALAAGQPYGIWVPPAYLGVLQTGLFLCFIPVARRRYLQAEQRKMAGGDLRGC